MPTQRKQRVLKRIRVLLRAQARDAARKAREATAQKKSRARTQQRIRNARRSSMRERCFA